jgi:hypothetical protein
MPLCNVGSGIWKLATMRDLVLGYVCKDASAFNTNYYSHFNDGRGDKIRQVNRPTVMLIECNITDPYQFYFFTRSLEQDFPNSWSAEKFQVVRLHVQSQSHFFMYR